MNNGPTLPKQMKRPTQKGKSSTKSPAPREKQNIFGHLATAMGGSLIKTTTKQTGFLATIKDIIISLSLFCAIGYIVGMVIDMFIGFGNLANAGALLMALLWLIRKGKKYIR
jgi:hypothetical protein